MDPEENGFVGWSSRVRTSVTARQLATSHHHLNRLDGIQRNGRLTCRFSQLCKGGNVERLAALTVDRQSRIRRIDWVDDSTVTSRRIAHSSPTILLILKKSGRSDFVKVQHHSALIAPLLQTPIISLHAPL